VGDFTALKRRTSKLIPITIILADVCNGEDVRGYPTMFLYSDGKKQDEFKG
jgi:hypothetical protein